MATIATLTYNAYMVLVFDKYNERYEGNYPNLKYKANVRARFEARNGGSFSVQATNTLKLGGLSATYGMYYGYGTTLTSWYEVGTISENMGCSRSKSWSWGCSCSGWPNLSGTASTSSPTIDAPTVGGSVDNIQQNSVDINWSMSSNNYDLYRVWIKKPDGSYTEQLGSSKGTYTLTGLEQNTDYKVQVEAWLADGSGSAVASKELSFKTLENYPEIVVEDIDIVVKPGETTDTVNFTAKTSDDSHVNQTIWQITGGPSQTQSGLEYTETELAQNATLTVTVQAKDTLGRTSESFSKQFNTTFTYKEVWVCQNGTWKKGYSMVAQIGEFELCELWVYTDQYGWQKAPVYEYIPLPPVETAPVIENVQRDGSSITATCTAVENAEWYTWICAYYEDVIHSDFEESFQTKTNEPNLIYEEADSSRSYILSVLAGNNDNEDVSETTQALVPLYDYDTLDAPKVTGTANISGYGVFRVEFVLPKGVENIGAKLYYKSSNDDDYTTLEMSSSGGTIYYNGLKLIKGLTYELYVELIGLKTINNHQEAVLYKSKSKAQDGDSDLPDPITLGTPTYTNTSGTYYRISLEVPSDIQIEEATLFYKSNLASDYTTMKMSISGNTVTLNNLSLLSMLEYDVYITVLDGNTDSTYESEHITI